MIAIDNSALIDPTTGIGNPPVNLALLVQVMTFSYNSGAKTVTITDGSTVTSPDTYANCNVTINDNQGGTIYGHIAAVSGNTGALDVSSLALSGPLTIKVTLTTTKGIQADGEANWVNASNNAGSIGNWQIDYTTA